MTDKLGDEYSQSPLGMLVNETRVWLDSVQRLDNHLAYVTSGKGLWIPNNPEYVYSETLKLVKNLNYKGKYILQELEPVYNDFFHLSEEITYLEKVRDLQTIILKIQLFRVPYLDRRKLFDDNLEQAFINFENRNSTFIISYNGWKNDLKLKRIQYDGAVKENNPRSKSAFSREIDRIEGELKHFKNSVNIEAKDSIRVKNAVANIKLDQVKALLEGCKEFINPDFGIVMSTVGDNLFKDAEARTKIPVVRKKNK